MPLLSNVPLKLVCEIELNQILKLYYNHGVVYDDPSLIVHLFKLLMLVITSIGLNASSGSSRDKNNYQILVSLLIVTGCYVCTWVATITILICVNIFGKHRSYQFLITIWSKNYKLCTFCFRNIGIAISSYQLLYWMATALNLSCNGYVYMIRSSKYREQMLKLVGLGKTNNVRSLTNKRLTV